VIESRPCLISIATLRNSSIFVLSIEGSLSLPVGSQSPQSLLSHGRNLVTPADIQRLSDC